MSVGIAGCVFTLSGIVRNSLSMLSCPYHCGGISPASNAADSFDRLLRESPLCMVPFPHGDAAAAQKECLLNQRRLHSMVSLSSTVPQMMSSWLVVAKECWNSVGYSE